jgi:hypothetical protein
MIKYILILIVLYLIFSLDLSCFKSFEYSCLVSMKDRLVGLVDIVVNFIDHTLIPTIDKFFENADLEKSIVGNTIDSNK